MKPMNSTVDAKKTPEITKFVTGWTESIGGRKELKAIKASDIKSHSYILIDVKCGDQVEQYYVTVN